MINEDCLVITCVFPSGRVGRAGRSGTAYSMICQDEMPYVYDLHLFLGRPVQFATPEHAQGRLRRKPDLLCIRGCQWTCQLSRPLPLSCHCLQFKPLLHFSRFRGCVWSGPSEYPGWRKFSSSHCSRKLPGPAKPASYLGECLQAVSEISTKPLTWVHQTGQKHRFVLDGRPSTLRSVWIRMNCEENSNNDMQTVVGKCNW